MPRTNPDTDIDVLAAALADLRVQVAPLVLARQERRRAGATAGERLSTPQHVTLLALRDGALSISALAAASGVAVSTATRMAQALERLGWIARAAPVAGEDRRHRAVALTPAGRAVMDEASEAVRVRMAHLLVHLDESERASIVAGMRALTKAIQAEEARAPAAEAASSADSTSSTPGAGTGSGLAANGRMPSRITPR